MKKSMIIVLLSMTLSLTSAYADSFSLSEEGIPEKEGIVQLDMNTIVMQQLCPYYPWTDVNPGQKVAFRPSGLSAAFLGANFQTAALNLLSTNNLMNQWADTCCVQLGYDNWYGISNNINFFVGTSSSFPSWGVTTVAVDSKLACFKAGDDSRY